MGWGQMGWGPMGWGQMGWEEGPARDNTTCSLPLHAPPYLSAPACPPYPSSSSSRSQLCQMRRNDSLLLVLPQLRGLEHLRLRCCNDVPVGRYGGREGGREGGGREGGRVFFPPDPVTFFPVLPMDGASSHQLGEPHL